MTTIENNDNNEFVFHHPTAIKTEYANIAYFCKIEEQLVKFYHDTCFSPIKITWVSAIFVGNYKGWPGLNVTNAAKYIHIENATAKGHLDTKQQGRLFTKNTIKHDD